MRCLFCKCPSHEAKSVEHIIPESLGNIRGNRRYLLPAGVVCDSCNNYFSRDVEGPLLSHRSFRNLRAWYQIPTKKKRLPTLVGTHIGTNIQIGLRAAKQGDELVFGAYSVIPERSSDTDQLIGALSSSATDGGFCFVLGDPPPAKLMSRFLAKMALEAHWLRFNPDLVDHLIDDPHYDRIRDWARRGNNYVDWPFSSRRIYPEETYMRHPDTDAWVQAGFAFDLLLTKRRETFFVFCLYGQEFAINVGGPAIRGYEEWLTENNSASPLVEGLGLHLRSEIKDNGAAHYLEDC
jgi:HNH endonuclease